MLGLAFDEIKENDYQEKHNGIKVVVDHSLLDSYHGFTVDYSKSWFNKGFVIRPERGGGTC